MAAGLDKINDTSSGAGPLPRNLVLKKLATESHDNGGPK